MRRVARALIVWGAFAVLSWLDGSAPARVSRADFGVSATIAVISFLGGLFGLFGGGVKGEIKRALEGMRSVIINVGESVTDYFKENGSFLSRMFGTLKRFWTAGIVPLLKWLRDKFVELQRWLRRMLQPLIRIIARLKTEWLNFYNKVLRPILDTISAVRFVLQVLGKFGVQWAVALDSKLAEWQAVITENFLKVLRALNRVEDTIDRVITFEYLIQRSALLRSLERDMLYVWRMAVNSRVSSGAHGSGDPVHSVEEVKQDTERALLHGDGRYAPFIAEMGAQWREHLRVP